MKDLVQLYKRNLFAMWVCTIWISSSIYTAWLTLLLSGKLLFPNPAWINLNSSMLLRVFCCHASQKAKWHQNCLWCLALHGDKLWPSFQPLLKHTWKWSKTIQTTIHTCNHCKIIYWTKYAVFHPLQHKIKENLIISYWTEGWHEACGMVWWTGSLNSRTKVI